MVNVSASMTHSPLRSMSAARNHRPSGVRRTSCGIADAPGRIWLFGPLLILARIGLSAPGVFFLFRLMIFSTLVAPRSMTRS